MRLGAAPAAVEAEAPARVGERKLEAEDVYRVYFHGPAYQVLARAWRTDQGIVGAFADGLPPGHDPEAAPLATSPRLLELCFQTAGAWEIAATGKLGLPAHIDRVRFYPPTSGKRRRRSRAKGGGAGVFAVLAAPQGTGPADLVVVDSKGRVLLGLEGYRTVPMPKALPDSLVAPLRDALLEGERPTEEEG